MPGGRLAPASRPDAADGRIDPRRPQLSIRRLAERSVLRERERADDLRIVQTGPITEFMPVSFTSNDDGGVMVLIRYAFTVAATGRDVAMKMHHHFRFRDGKTCYVRSAEDTAQVAAALAA